MMTIPPHEVRLALIEGRLATGAEAFAELRGDVRDVKSGNRKLVWFGASLVAAALGIAFSAGQFVTGVDETRKAQRETSSQVDEVKASVSAIEAEQIRIRAAVDAIATGQARLERKIDTSDTLGRRRPR